MHYVVFLDLDNTFWSVDGVPDSAVEAIRRAQAHGHRVFANTGRSRGETRDLLQYGLDGRCYAAGTEAYLGTQRIVDHPLGVEVSRTMLSLLDIGEGILIAEGGDQCFVRGYDKEYLAQARAECARTNDPFLEQPDIDAMGERDHAQIYKYSLWVRGGVPEDVLSSMPAGYVPTSMGDATEFTNVRFSKATVLETMRAIVSERDGHEYTTMALGDSGNDIPMLHAAQVSVCMGNGTAEAKAVADYVTTSIDDDGLCHAFEHFGLI